MCRGSFEFQIGAVTIMVTFVIEVAYIEELQNWMIIKILVRSKLCCNGCKPMNWLEFKLTIYQSTHTLNIDSGTTTSLS